MKGYVEKNEIPKVMAKTKFFPLGVFDIGEKTYVRKDNRPTTTDNETYTAKFKNGFIEVFHSSGFFMFFDTSKSFINWENHLDT